MLEEISKTDSGRDIMKSTTFVRSIISVVCFVQYAVSHPALQNPGIQGEHTNTLPNGAYYPKDLSISKSERKNVSRINQEDGGVTSLDSRALENGHPFTEGDNSAVEKPVQNHPKDFHNLSVFEYVERFNASEVQDQNKIHHFLATQRHMEDQDGSEGSNAVAKVAAARERISPEVRKGLEEEFVKHHQRECKRICRHQR